MIKFLDLKALNARYQNELKNKFENFLNSGNYILGAEVAGFEEEYAHYCGAKYCIGVSSGLDALQLIFEAYKTLRILKNADEVIVPANTYIATVLAISNTGLTPVLVEPNPETFNIDPDAVLRAITPKTKAILGVHLYGQLYDVLALETISNTHNLILIEDAAQAHGAVFADGRKAGNVANVAAFSFYPTKNLGALGDAGAIATNNLELAETIQKLRNYGRTSAYKNEFKGYNSRLDELQASFLRIKLKHLDIENDKRRKIAQFYLENINSNLVILPVVDNLEQHVFHQFVIRCEKRNELQAFLSKNGIETLIHYPLAVHKQKAYSELYSITLPISEKLSETVLSLPLNAAITETEQVKIVSVINQFK